MDNAPVEAPSPAPAEPSVETPTNNGSAEAPAQPQVDMYGFSQDDLAGMRRFIDNNGGWDAIKQKISAPKNAQPQQTEQNNNIQEQQAQPTSQTNAPESMSYRAPKGAITAQEFLAEQYFKSLAGEEKYANIADGVRNGDYLKEMSAFGINVLNQDGSINDNKVRMYLDLKAQTVPAKPTEAEPNASAAPTVTYTEVGEKGIENIDQAYKILMEPGNANRAKAEDFIRKTLNKQ